MSSKSDIEKMKEQAMYKDSMSPENEAFDNMDDDKKEAQKQKVSQKKNEKIYKEITEMKNNEKKQLSPDFRGLNTILSQSIITEEQSQKQASEIKSWLSSNAYLPVTNNNGLFYRYENELKKSWGSFSLWYWASLCSPNCTLLHSYFESLNNVYFFKESSQYKANTFGIVDALLKEDKKGQASNFLVSNLHHLKNITLPETVEKIHQTATQELDKHGHFLFLAIAHTFYINDETIENIKLDGIKNVFAKYFELFPHGGQRIFREIQNLLTGYYPEADKKFLTSRLELLVDCGVVNTNQALIIAPHIKAEKWYVEKLWDKKMKEEGKSQFSKEKNIELGKTYQSYEIKTISGEKTGLKTFLNKLFKKTLISPTNEDNINAGKEENNQKTGNKKDKKTTFNFLHEAALANNAEIFKFFLEQGERQELNPQGHYPQNYLFGTRYDEGFKVEKFSLSYPNNAYYLNMNQTIEILKMLSESKFNIFQKNRNGTTFLKDLYSVSELNQEQKKNFILELAKVIKQEEFKKGLEDFLSESHAGVSVKEYKELKILLEMFQLKDMAKISLEKTEIKKHIL